MASRELAQMRARLGALRAERNRLVHRTPDLEHHFAEIVAKERGTLQKARDDLAAARDQEVRFRAEADSYERSGSTAGGQAAWESAWRAASERWSQAVHRTSVTGRWVRDAEERLQQAIAQQEYVAAEEARALARLEQEIGELNREVSRLQAEEPPVEAPDPRFREMLLERLHDLEEERNWLGQEIAQREERVQRIGAESAQIHTLLEMHAPAWGREALSSLAPEKTPERAPAWKQGVLEILRSAEHPLHYRELAVMLSATGRALGGQDPAETLLAALGRDRDIVRVGRGTYWLRSRPLPDDPDRSTQRRTGGSGEGHD